MQRTRINTNWTKNVYIHFQEYILLFKPQVAVDTEKKAKHFFVCIFYNNGCTSRACAPSRTASLLGRPIFTPPSARASTAVNACKAKKHNNYNDGDTDKNEGKKA